MSSEAIVIRKNFSISEVLEEYNKGTRSEEIVYLKNAVDRYKDSMENRIYSVLSEMPTGDRSTVMKWITETVDEDIKAYVRMAYLGKLNEGDVLKRSPGKYKTISDIGIQVQEPARTEKTETMMRIWSEEAEKLRSVLDSPDFIGTKIWESHAHYNLYNLEQYKNCYKELLDLIHKSGVEVIINPAVEYATIRKMKELFDAPEYHYIYYAFASHPKYLWKEQGFWTNSRWEEFMDVIKSDRKCVAVGEAGLDYSYSEFDEVHRDMQMDFFKNFIDAANFGKLPMILHIRPSGYDRDCLFDAHNDALRILTEKPVKQGAVLHCFNSDRETMEHYIKAGVKYFGIGGCVTYGDKLMEEAVRDMPEDSILLETDSPFIKIYGESLPNTSMSLYEISRKIGEIRGCSAKHILDVSRENMKRLFFKNGLV